MMVRRRATCFRPSVDILPSRISPTIYTPIDLASMGDVDTNTTVTTTITATVQAIPSTASELVGPSCPM